ncbi:MAG TPA: PadR family transcriptional regulator [Actinomycetota bacterium]
MSVSMSLLAILDEGSSYGLQLRNEFEARTGGVWPLNVGQVYTTLDRLERDDLVALQPQPEPEGSKVYQITAAGREQLAAWFSRPSKPKTPSRDELVLKLVMISGRDAGSTAEVVQAERRAAIELLQEYTLLKRDASEDADLGWLFLVDSLIFQAEARVRWLDACEERLARMRPRSTTTPAPASQPSEVRK